MVIVADHDIGQETEDEELHPDQHEEDADERPHALCDRRSESELLDEHPDEDAGAHDREHDARTAEEMDRAMRVLAPEPDRHHIDEALDAALPVVLGHAMDARMMRYLDLSHAETVERQERRHETMHLTEEIHIAEAFAAIRLQAAAGIMDIVLDQDLAEQIGDTGRDLLTPWILTLVPPAGHHIIPLVDLLKEERDISRIVLQVAVERDDDLTGRCLDTSIKSRRLAEILAERDEPERMALLRLFERLVLGPVIDEDDLKGPTDLLKRLADLAMKLEHIPLFVVQRHDDRQVRLVFWHRFGLTYTSLLYRTPEKPAIQAKKTLMLTFQNTRFPDILDKHKSRENSPVFICSTKKFPSSYPAIGKLK